MNQMLSWSLLGIGCLMLAGCSEVATSPRITVIGHRGYSSQNPENTLSAFRGAIAAGADYAELDARPSADGTLWILHDATLDRTTDAVGKLQGKKIKITSVRDEQLWTLDAGSWYDARFAGEPLPTLEAALDAIQAKGKTLLEHKDGPAQAYADLLKRKGYVDKLIVQSFNWKFLEDLHALLPDQTLAALGDKELTASKLEQIGKTGSKIVAWNYKDLAPERIAELHKAGYKVFIWTCDDPAEWQRFADAGVNGIITNKSGELRAWLKNRH